jgi:hypothetical protein
MTTSVGSAYPKQVQDLIPMVREWAAEMGRHPSRNQIMSRFHVGAPKAKEALAALVEPRFAESAEAPQGESVALDPADADTEVFPVVDPDASASVDEEPAQVAAPTSVRPWPVVLLALPAFVSIWGGWVGLGRMTGFGPVALLPGIWDHVVLNSAITLPIGVEAYAAFALRVWLSGASHSDRTRKFAKWSAFGALALGMAGQIAYHLMSAASVQSAPWLVTTAVACLPVGVLGCGAALAHLLITDAHAGEVHR